MLTLIGLVFGWLLGWYVIGPVVQRWLDSYNKEEKEAPVFSQPCASCLMLTFAEDGVKFTCRHCGEYGFPYDSRKKDE